jgi:hypothetical protein
MPKQAGIKLVPVVTSCKLLLSRELQYQKVLYSRSSFHHHLHISVHTLLNYHIQQQQLHVCSTGACYLVPRDIVLQQTRSCASSLAPTIITILKFQPFPRAPQGGRDMNGLALTRTDGTATYLHLYGLLYYMYAHMIAITNRQTHEFWETRRWVDR